VKHLRQKRCLLRFQGAVTRGERLSLEEYDASETKDLLKQCSDFSRDLLNEHKYLLHEILSQVPHIILIGFPPGVHDKMSAQDLANMVGLKGSYVRVSALADLKGSHARMKAPVHLICHRPNNDKIRQLRTAQMGEIIVLRVIDYYFPDKVGHADSPGGAKVVSIKIIHENGVLTGTCEQDAIDIFLKRGHSKQCVGTTKYGQQCKRNTLRLVNNQPYCWQHVEQIHSLSSRKCGEPSNQNTASADEILASMEQNFSSLTVDKVQMDPEQNTDRVPIVQGGEVIPNEYVVRYECGVNVFCPENPGGFKEDMLSVKVLVTPLGACSDCFWIRQSEGVEISFPLHVYIPLRDECEYIKVLHYDDACVDGETNSLLVGSQAEVLEHDVWLLSGYVEIKVHHLCAIVTARSTAAENIPYYSRPWLCKVQVENCTGYFLKLDVQNIEMLSRRTNTGLSAGLTGGGLQRDQETTLVAAEVGLKLLFYLEPNETLYLKVRECSNVTANPKCHVSVRYEDEWKEHETFPISFGMAPYRIELKQSLKNIWDGVL